MRLASIAFKVSFLLRRASNEVTLDGPGTKAHLGEDNVTIDIPMAIRAPWSTKTGPYGKAAITFNWVDAKVPQDDMGLVDDAPIIELVSIDGFGLSPKDQKALESVGLNDLVLSRLYAEDEDEDAVKLPNKSLSDWLL